MRRVRVSILETIVIAGVCMKVVRVALTGRSRATAPAIREIEEKDQSLRVLHVCTA